jgi:hypothetical protein
VRDDGPNNEERLYFKIKIAEVHMCYSLCPGMEATLGCQGETKQHGERRICPYLSSVKSLSGAWESTASLHSSLSLHPHTVIAPDEMITPTILDSGTLDSSLNTLDYILSRTRNEAQDCILWRTEGVQRNVHLIAQLLE